MKRKATTKATPKVRVGQLVLSQTQVGLALGFGAIGLIMAFGVGFIVGMWYQASEQIIPYDAGLAPAAEQQAEDRPMTFYSTLTESQKSTTSPSGSTTGAIQRQVPASRLRYSVQVGSFRVWEQAERLHGRLVHKGYPVRIQSSQVPGKGVWYRVRVGEFSSRAAADRTAQRLVSQERLSVMITNETQ